MRLALIGAGGIGSEWVQALEDTKGVRLALIADVSLKRAQALANRFTSCEAVSDWQAATTHQDIDAVVVATPHAFLAPISYAALVAGKHVLCEKPAGVNAKEIAKNIRMAAKKNLVYMVGFNHRYHPAFMKAKEIAQKGGIGEIDFVRARYGFGGRPGYGKEWRFKKEIAGGGEFMDQGMHMIDMARWFLGDFKTVYGFAENFFWRGDVEDNGFALMRTSSRKVASIHVSWTNWDWVHSFEVFGKEGYLLIDALDQRYNGPERLVWGRRDKTFARPTTKEYVFREEKKRDSMRRELEDFVRSVRSGKTTTQFPSGEDAEAAVRIVDKIYANHHGVS